MGGLISRFFARARVEGVNPVPPIPDVLPELSVEVISARMVGDMARDFARRKLLRAYYDAASVSIRSRRVVWYIDLTGVFDDLRKETITYRFNDRDVEAWVSNGRLGVFDADLYESLTPFVMTDDVDRAVLARQLELMLPMTSLMSSSSGVAVQPHYFYCSNGEGEAHALETKSDIYALDELYDDDFDETCTRCGMKLDFCRYDIIPPWDWEYLYDRPIDDNEQ